MKKILFSWGSVLLLLGSYAQQLPNNSFENWDTEHFDDLSYYYDSSDEGHHNLIKSTDRVEGNYSARLESVIENGDFEVGYFINFDPDDFSGGIPYSAHVDTIKFNYKAYLVAQDSALVLAFFKKNGTIIGGKLVKIAADRNTNSWSEYTFATDMPQGMTPDTLMFGAASSNAISEIGMEAGSWIMLDNFRFISNNGFAPGIPNDGFEEWNDKTIEKPQGYQTSIEWDSSTITVEKNSEATDGLYSIKLINKINDAGDLTHATVTNGDIFSSWPYSGGMPLVNVPDAVSFDVKAHRINNDEAGITFIFKNQGNSVYEDGRTYRFDINNFQRDTIQFNITQPVDTLTVVMWNGDVENSTIQFDNIVLYYPVGIQSNLKISELKAFPVPARNFLQFEIEAIEPEKIQIEIDDMNGKRIVSRTFILQSGTNRLKMDTGMLPQGNYVYQISASGGQIARTFIKK